MLQNSLLNKICDEEEVSNGDYDDDDDDDDGEKFIKNDSESESAPEDVFENAKSDDLIDLFDLSFFTVGSARPVDALQIFSSDDKGLR